jgi:hypothetical protein
MQIRHLKIRPTVSIVFLIMIALFSQLSSVDAAVVRADKDIYNQGEAIRVHFTNAPGNDSDWMCIVPAGSPDTDAGDYKYMPRGLGQGLLLFDPRSPGEYEVRAYYNYRRNGYVVSGRYAFSVVSDPFNEEAFAQPMEPIEPNDALDSDLPPSIPFAAPPELIVLPETYVYVVPDVDVDIFFYNGWWWRPWDGRWYRSHFYDRGWGYYDNVPSFYFDVDSGWRGYYRDRNWYGHRWDYERIPNQRLQQNWKSWQNDRRWERRGTWGVQNYQPRPQQQRQELRQQRQQQYQQRPEVQRPQGQSQVQQPQRQELRQQRQQQYQQRPEVQRQQRQSQVQQPQRQELRQQRQQQYQQRPEVQRQQRQSQGKPDRGEAEHGK